MIQLSLPVKWRKRGRQAGGGAGLPIVAWHLVPQQEALEGSPSPTHHIPQHEYWQQISRDLKKWCECNFTDDDIA